MSILITISTIVFVISSVLLVIIILLQSDKSAGMGILGGSTSQSAFGSSTADVITKITTILVAIFMLGSLGLAVLESWRAKSIERGLVTDGEKPSGVIEKTATKSLKDKDAVTNKEKKK